MLLDSFYTVSDFSHSDLKISAGIYFRAEHEIFKGHFPGTPVVPGVCMMQMIKELFFKATGVQVKIRRASQVKFLTVISPLHTPAVMFEMTYKKVDEGYQVQASLANQPTIFFKFNGLLAETI